VVESVGDYYACARLAGAPPPPRHAINRGIGMEGVGGLLAGLMGSGSGTTSYSENIGAIGLTKVGSVRVVQAGALVMLLCGVLGKFSAVFVSIPEPVVGGVFCVMFAMITAVGLSALQSVDLSSSRNLFVLGFPLFLGLALPKWLDGWLDATGFTPEDTPVPALTQIALVLLRTSMFVGGFLGVLLDNTVPGTRKERGLDAWEEKMDTGGKTDAKQAGLSVYDFPVGMDFVRRTPVFKKIPFSPTFEGWKFSRNK